MAAHVAIHGLEARDGDTAFAFVIVRLTAPADYAAVVAVVRQLAPLLPDAEQFLAGLQDPLDEPVRMLGIPWTPAEPHALAAQRHAVETAGGLGVETVWCFQTGTSVPPGAEADTDTDTDAEADAAWSNGLPPQVASVRFPVDGYPAIINVLDSEDFGVAFKLAGAWTPGENLALIGFHTLWLAPYNDRYRNAAVTIDERHHSAHLWVDRFAAPCSPEAQVRHLLWVLAKIDEVTPILHARFGGATMAQKYGRLMGETDEAFVLGGNPLLGEWGEGGDGGDARVERWLAEQRGWSTEEIAQMLRELAVEIVTGGVAVATGEEAEAEAATEAEAETGTDTRAETDHEDAEDDDRGRQIATYAGEVLAARAERGLLSAGAAEKLRPVLGVNERFEHRRRAVVEIVGALRDRAAVPALLRILDDNPIKSALDSIGKDELLANAAAALGAIGDPAAIPTLARVVAAPGTFNDKPRPVAGDALARCLAAALPPRVVGDDVLAALLTNIEHDRDAEHGAACQLAYGRIAAQLPEASRIAARARLATAPVTRGGAISLVARHAALAIAGAESASAAERAAVAGALHASLTGLGYDHDGTVRDLRMALRGAAALPELVEVDDLVWLTRFSEPDIRASAHTLLATRGHALADAPVFDRAAAEELGAGDLIRLIGEPHVVGRGALIAEAGRRGLPAARPAVAAAAVAVIERARHGDRNLLDPDARVLEAAVVALRRHANGLDDTAVALFDRMLRHSNHHVKWELLQEVPADERLLGGMFHVLGEKWGWQEGHAKEWLAKFRGRPAYEAARRGASDGAAAAADDDDSAETN